MSTSGFALSCFDTQLNAEESYKKIAKVNNNFSKTVGNAITSGCLVDKDGVIGSCNKNGHFDLYEYMECDLSKTFSVVSKLV